MSSADVRGLTERMLTDLRGDDAEGLATLLASVVAPDAPRRHLLCPLLGELVSMVAHDLRERAEDGDDAPGVDGTVGVDGTAGGSAGGGTFTAELVDDEDEPFDIDDLDPAVRAVLRAVLAELNDDPGDVRFHLGLIGADPEPLARLDAVWHVLLWASMLDEGAA
ncbi:hypothetical protein [Saccharomonospora iraqiensis]|uniref:hypothetical protein n=1 Tax=Saccharomonospora iraqiensis TaxID=52698 RepID=UPI0003FB51BD|nr:hypothetical protein [Saccharomonospora iraqiensis]